jgi:hypothetical protein
LNKLKNWSLISKKEKKSSNLSNFFRPKYVFSIVIIITQNVMENHSLNSGRNNPRPNSDLRESPTLEPEG